MKEEKNQLTRRDFVKNLSVLGVASIGASAFLKACGNGEQAADVDDPCADLSDLTEEDIQTREMFQYTAETPNPSERCDNCEFWVDDQYGDACGGCTLFRGPVHPGGWCNSWVAKQS